MNSNQNEMILLLALADGEQHNEPPTGLTVYQYKKAAEDLKAKGLIFAQFGTENGEPKVFTQIDDDGQAMLDDMERDRKHFLFEILQKHDLTTDEYEILKKTKEMGEVPRTRKWKALSDKKKCFDPVRDKHGCTIRLVLSNSGIQLLEEIEYELSSQLFSLQNMQQNSHTKTKEEETTSKSVKLDRFECLYLTHEMDIFKDDAPAYKIAAYISMLTGYSPRTMREDYKALTAYEKIDENRKKEILDEYNRKMKQ